MYVVGGAVAVLAGCLFPSFDDLKGTGAAPDPTEEPDAAKRPGSSASSASGGTSGSASSTSSSTSSGEILDAAKDTSGPPVKKVVACGGQDCDLATQFCCDNGSGKCVPKGSSCTIWELHCDETADCNAGEQCCQRGSNLTIDCATNCGGDAIICRKGTQCGAKSCGGSLPFGPPSVETHECN